MEKSPEQLKTDTFTIVGSGTWSWYLSWSRGAASIGDGSLDAFVVVPESAFDMDYYTEIYAMVNGVRDMSTYSDAYTDAVKLVTDRIEEIAGERCDIRYTEIYEDAEQALEDAREKVENGTDELKKAQQELEDGKKAYDEGKASYDEGMKTYQAGKSQWEQGKSQLEASKAKLSNGWEAYQNGLWQLRQAEEAVASGKEEIAYQEAQIEAGEIQLADAKEQIAAAEQQISQAQAQIDASDEEYQSKKAEYDKQASAYEGEASKVKALEEKLSQSKQKTAALQAEIDSLQQQLNQIEETEGSDSEAYKEVQSKISAKQSELTAAESEQEQLQSQYQAAEAQLQPVKSQLDQALMQLQSAEQSLNAAKSELSAKKQALSDKKDEIAAAEMSIEDGKQQIESAKSEISQNEALISTNRSKLAASRQELEAGEQAVSAGEKQLSESKKELDQAEEKLKTAEEELLHAREKLEEGQKTYQEEAAKAEKKLADARKQIADGEKQLVELDKGRWYVLGRDTIQNSVEYGMDAERIGAIGKVFPLIFFLVAALVSLTTMTRMIEEERVLIGTMKALGYGKLQIASKYILYAFSATLIGGLGGVVFGSKVLPFVIMKAYSMLYSNVQCIVTPVHWDLCVLAIAMAMVCTVGAAIAACYKELMSTPATLMRPPAPKQGKRVFLEYIPFIWKHLNFSMKSTIRNLVRYKKRLFMTVAGIGGCTAILLVSFGLSDSIAEIAKNQYKNIWTYSAASGIEQDSLQQQKEQLDAIVEENDNIQSVLLTKNISLDVSKEKTEKTAQIFVIENLENIDEYLNLHDRVTKEPQKLTNEGVILSEKLASLLDVKKGDTITLKISDTKMSEVTITGIAENYMYHYIYMTPTVYEQAFGKTPEYNQVFWKFNGQLDEKEAEKTAQYLLGKDMIESVALVNEIQKAVDDMMNALNLVVWVLIISAGLLVFVVLFNLNNINISERRRELASLKVLGFSDMEVAMYVYRENFLLTIIGIVVGLILGTWLHKYLIATLEVDMIMFGRHINNTSYLYSVIFTILFAMFVNIAMFYKLRQIDMVESLKSVE